MANTRIARDLDDRLADRVADVKARAETNEDKSSRERIEAFRDKWANNALPEILVLPRHIYKPSGWRAKLWRNLL